MTLGGLSSLGKLRSVAGTLTGITLYQQVEGGDVEDTVHCA